MSEGAHHWRSLLNTALTVAAIGASLLAITVLITLGWWLRSLSSAPPPEATVHSLHRAPRTAAAPPRGVPPPAQPATPPVQQAHAAVALPPTAAPTAAAPTPRQNDDAAKNRALGAALSRLGDDPELRRKLGLDGTNVPP